ncbi:nuclear transport factor 2 family protein [Rhodanobacter sp. AS-Z3]|uniref:nuclear transport factor 2 family protein n=1 Tax=Rhodanobacter sp. AS-Z3 TaxID=3031330 RepID=UPI00247867D0|nr:nuclear transport factor 2 family protein [Rhodanobacter sp. AS-Z3]WEN14395.1 nuclear transport factor 2 family protein [Rhodanobacter sp. AS-Z3]
MVNAEKREVIERYVDAYNRFDVDGMLAMLAPDLLFENVSAGQVNAAAHGLVEFRQLAEQGASLFTERKQVIKAWSFRPASVLVTIAWRGVFAVDIPDGPRAGSALELPGESEFEFDGARISRIVDRS